MMSDLAYRLRQAARMAKAYRKAHPLRYCETLRNRLLRAAIRALYRLGRWDHHTIPVGIPTIRDPEYRCEGYSPTLSDDRYDCAGDGHYLCVECLHHKDEETDDEP